jgi:hypothetical protein
MGIFNTKKEESSILDCFTYDLTTFFYDDYEEVDSVETPATFMIVYQKELPWKELNFFDAVQFRIFFDKESISGSNPVNVKFINKNKKGGVVQVKKLVERVSSIYKADDKGVEGWGGADEEAVGNNSFRRVWTIEKGESFVSVESTEQDGITLSILFFNNLIKSSDKYLDLKH